jgi:hypothetical protein
VQKAHVLKAKALIGCHGAIVSKMAGRVPLLGRTGAIRPLKSRKFCLATERFDAFVRQGRRHHLIAA